MKKKPDLLTNNAVRQIAKEAIIAEKEGVGWEEFAKYKGIPLDEMEAILGLYLVETENSYLMETVRRLILSKM